MESSSEFALKYKWDVKVGSPRKLFRALLDFLDDYGYEHGEDWQLKFEDRGAIEGIAVFNDEIAGKKDFRRRNRTYLIVALILGVMGIIFLFQGEWGPFAGSFILIAGIVFALKSKSILRRTITFHLAGESYRTSARGERASAADAEVVGIMSDVRLTVTGEVGSPAKANEGKVGNFSKNENEWAELKKELQGLRNKVDQLLPQLELPSVVERTKD